MGEVKFRVIEFSRLASRRVKFSVSGLRSVVSSSPDLLKRGRAGSVSSADEEKSLHLRKSMSSESVNAVLKPEADDVRVLSPSNSLVMPSPSPVSNTADMSPDPHFEDGSRSSCPSSTAYFSQAALPLTVDQFFQLYLKSGLLHSFFINMKAEKMREKNVHSPCPSPGFEQNLADVDMGLSCQSISSTVVSPLYVGFERYSTLDSPIVIDGSFSPGVFVSNHPSVQQSFDTIERDVMRTLAQSQPISYGEGAVSSLKFKYNAFVPIVSLSSNFDLHKRQLQTMLEMFVVAYPEVKYTQGFKNLTVFVFNLAMWFSFFVFVFGRDVVSCNYSSSPSQ
jgi:hypothetical protein